MLGRVDYLLLPIDATQLENSYLVMQRTKSEKQPTICEESFQQNYNTLCNG